jgi:hypothetical protein
LHVVLLLSRLRLLRKESFRDTLMPEAGGPDLQSSLLAGAVSATAFAGCLVAIQRNRRFVGEMV